MSAKYRKTRGVARSFPYSVHIRENIIQKRAITLFVLAEIMVLME